MKTYMSVSVPAETIYACKDFCVKHNVAFDRLVGFLVRNGCTVCQNLTQDVDVRQKHTQSINLPLSSEDGRIFHNYVVRFGGITRSKAISRLLAKQLRDLESYMDAGGSLDGLL